jgi:hypothetical protein
MVSMRGITGAAARGMDMLKNIATPDLSGVDDWNQPEEAQSIPYTEMPAVRLTVTPDDLVKIREFVHLKLFSEQSLCDGEVVDLVLQVYLQSFTGDGFDQEKLIENLTTSLALEFKFESLKVVIRSTILGDVHLEFYRLTVERPVRQKLQIRPISSQSFKEFFMTNSMSEEEAFLNHLLVSIAEELESAGYSNPEEACKSKLQIKLTSTTVVPIEYQFALVERLRLTDVPGAYFVPKHSIDTGEGIVQTFEFGINEAASN